MAGETSFYIQCAAWSIVAFVILSIYLLKRKKDKKPHEGLLLVLIIAVVFIFASFVGALGS